MKIKHYIALSFILAVAFLSSCAGSGSSSQVDFSNPEKLQCDSIAINEILSPQSWFKIKDKAVVLSPKSENLFYVYSLPAWDLLYSFGKIGEGPDDFQYPNASVAPDEYLSVKSYSRQGVNDRIFDLTAEKPQLITMDTINRRLMNVKNKVNDSIYLITIAPTFEYGKWHDPYQLFIGTADKNAEHVDSVLTNTISGFKISDYKGGGISISGREFNRPFFTCKDGKVYLFYTDVRRMDIYSLSADGHFSLDKTIGDATTWEELQKQNIPDTPQGEEVYAVHWGEKYIYAFVCDYQNQGTWRKVINSYVEVWDYNGEKVKKYDLSRNFTHFIADEANDKFYLYHSGYDFENVYIYDFKI